MNLLVTPAHSLFKFGKQSESKPFQKLSPAALLFLAGTETWGHERRQRHGGFASWCLRRKAAIPGGSQMWAITGFDVERIRGGGDGDVCVFLR